MTALNLCVAQGLNLVTKRVAEDLVKASVSSVRTLFPRSEILSQQRVHARLKLQEIIKVKFVSNEHKDKVLIYLFSSCMSSRGDFAVWDYG